DLALALRKMGINRWTLSPELTLEQVGLMARLGGGEAIVHGSLTMMVSEYCAPGAILGRREREQACGKPCHKGRFGLKDRMNFVFPVETDQYCHMHVFNPKELCLIDELPVLADQGLAALRLELKRSDARYVSRVVKAYRQELDMIKKKGPRYQVPAGIREELEALSPAGFTKGHYYRGV
ncbi:MAG: U32 family peptidase, partial [Clostridia bacterium]|nr:U32 family peptidase [Clostridia bacterium]